MGIHNSGLSSCAVEWIPLGPQFWRHQGPCCPQEVVVAVLPLSWGGWVSLTCDCPTRTAEKSEPHALFLSTGRVRKSQLRPHGRAFGRVPGTMPESYDKNSGPGLCTSALLQVQGAQNHTWVWGERCSDNERETQALLWKEKEVLIREAIYFSDKQTLPCGCHPSGTLASFTFIQQIFIGSFWVPHTGDSSENKTDRLLPSWNSHSNGEKTMNIIKKPVTEQDQCYGEKKK